MKKLALYAVVSLSLSISCQKDKPTTNVTQEETVNETTNDLTGEHRFTYSVGDMTPLDGNIDFMKTGPNEYEVVGNAKDEEGFIHISGKMTLTSEGYLAFHGKIEENIHESSESESSVRDGDQVFKAVENEGFWRIEGLTDDQGVEEHIDIYF